VTCAQQCKLGSELLWIYDSLVVMTDNANTLPIRYKGSMDNFEPLNINLNKQKEMKLH
jgi:hypothetical protein